MCRVSPNYVPGRWREVPVMMRRDRSVAAIARIFSLLGGGCGSQLVVWKQQLQD